jgi:arylformamidase
MAFHDMPDRGRLVLPEAEEITGRMLALSKAIVPNLRCDLDVPYGTDFLQKLDIFLPEKNAKPVPVLMFFHGGAWRHGYKEWEGFIAPNITSLPAIFISGNYRLAPEAKWPAQLNDVADALAWVHTNITRYGGDPDRIFIGGHSAGGHLTTMLTLRSDYRLTRHLPDDVVKACFPMSALFEVRCDRLSTPGAHVNTALNLLVQPSDDRDASPVQHTAGNRTPFYISYGSEDTPSIKDDAAKMIPLLRRESGPVEVDVFHGLSHFATNEACKDPEFGWIKKVRSWMAVPRARGIAT